MKRRAEDNQQLVRLNVGGTAMQTRVSTLRDTMLHFPDSVLAVWFADEGVWCALLCDDGTYFIDAEPRLFAAVLQVLRRPCTLALVPTGVSEEAWRTELDFWGLSHVANTTTAATAEPAPPRESLAALGAQIKREVAQTEATVVQQLLERSGFLAKRGKSRHHALYVPQQGGALPWGQELYAYLRDHSSDIVDALKRCLGEKVLVSIDGYTSRTVHVYSFDGVQYSAPAQKTMQVTLKLTWCDLDK